MTSPVPDPRRFLSHIEASRREEDLFKGLYVDADPDRQTLAALRRRRRRAVNDIDSTMKAVSLVEDNGTLYWRDGIPSRPAARRRGRRGLDAADEGSLVLTKEFPTLAPNKIIAAVGAIDRRLNQAIDDTLQSRLRSVRQTPAGTFEFDAKPPSGPFSGRTLLFVHGTFSNAGNMLAE